MCGLPNTYFILYFNVLSTTSWKYIWFSKKAFKNKLSLECLRSTDIYINDDLNTKSWTALWFRFKNILPRNNFSVVRNILGKKQFIRGRVFTKPMICGRTSIHERLSNHRQTGIHRRCLVYIKDEIWVFYEINPKSQRKTEITKMKLYYQLSIHIKWMLNM